MTNDRRSSDESTVINGIGTLDDLLIAMLVSLRHSFARLPSLTHPTKLTSQRFFFSTMAQADISIFKNADDGHFRRAASSYRDVIEKGGRFEPEKGTSARRDVSEVDQRRR